MNSKTIKNSNMEYLNSKAQHLLRNISYQNSNSTDSEFSDKDEID